MTVELPETTGPLEPPRSNGRLAATNHVAGQSMPAGPPTEVSSYVQYLPGPYQSDPFVGRFLMIAESILGPIERTVEMILTALPNHAR